MTRSLIAYGSILAFVLAIAGCTQEEAAKPAAKSAAEVAPTPLARGLLVDEEDDPDYPEDLEELYVDLEAEPDEGEPPLTVQWTSEVEDGTEPYTYLWEFGDGTAPSTETNPTHTYKSEGDFTTVLKVKDSKGLWGSEEYDVLVEKE